MSKYFTVWMSFGILSPLLLGVGAFECLQKVTLLRLIPPTKVTDCTMECSGMTYYKKLQIQDKHNIRLIDSKEDDLGEYCWPMEFDCTIGETFHQAFVVLPVDVAVRHEQVEVYTTAPTVTTLHVHSSPTTLAEACGLVYDVTEHFSAGRLEKSFCVQVVAQEDRLGDKFLRCPPSLAIFWHRGANQSNQQGGG